MKSQKLKRIIDVIGALIGLVVFFPIMLIVAFVIYITMGKPIFFKQIRAGKDGEPFTIYKFRSMLDIVDQDGNPLPDDERLTKTGKILQRFRLDELPELYNILKGDMSFIGPRPTLIEQISSYNNFQKNRLKFRPGLTGWAQVNGNTMLSWNDRILLDVWYIDHWSLLLDLKIIMYTIDVVLRGERINFKALEEANRYEIYTHRSG